MSTKDENVSVPAGLTHEDLEWLIWFLGVGTGAAVKDLGRMRSDRETVMQRSVHLMNRLVALREASRP